MNHDHAQHDPSPSGFWCSRYAIGAGADVAMESAQVVKRVGSQGAPASGVMVAAGASA